MSKKRRREKLGRKEDDCKETQTLDGMFHVLMEEVFPRLPVKSLIRFKCVCKTWFFKISSKSFAKSYLDLRVSSSSPSRQVMMYAKRKKFGNYNHVFLLKYDEQSGHKEVVDLDLKFFSPVMNHKFSLVGSCNGLVCLYSETNYFYRVWNPATQVYRDIHKPDPHVVEKFFDGFGYVTSLDDYKIIANFAAGLHVFSLRTGTWEIVANRPDYFGYRFGRKFGKSVWIGESIFWLVEYNAILRIFSFDLGCEQFTEIPMMDEPRIEYRYRRPRVDLWVINGCLSLSCQLSQGRKTHVWMLKQPGPGPGVRVVRDSWQKLYCLKRGLSLVAVFDNGKCLVAGTPGSKRKVVRQLDVLDPALDASKQSRSGIDFPYLVASMRWNYVESFVSPYGSPNFHSNIGIKLN